MHEFVEKHFHGKQTNIVLESISTALALVKSDLGFTVVPSYIVKYGDNDDIYFEEIKSSIKGMFTHFIVSNNSFHQVKNDLLNV